MKIAVHWFRCDLRLEDNTALLAAIQSAEAVIPVFIFDPAILKSDDVSANQLAFMIECLRQLEADIVKRGGTLIFRHGPVRREMEAVLRESGASALFYNRDYEPYARERDGEVEKMAASLGVEVHSYRDSVIHEFDEVLKPDGRPYTVYTPYRRKWEAATLSPTQPTGRLSFPAKIKYPRGIPLPSATELGFKVEITLPAAGEKAARKILRQFISRFLSGYDRERNFPAQSGTSAVSPHLRLGTLSPRQIVEEAQKAKLVDNATAVATFVSELAWRDFYKMILWHFPHVAKGAFRPQYDQIKWDENQKFFAAWCQGKTGFPLVDAGMRQLNTTGWMHNRIRMVTATFLSKDLQISWQWGERYFMQKLLDADLSSNNGGWQWCAGTGTDAQPWFRIFNPLAQAQKFDPEGHYIHRYVPEIDTGDYPAPMVDHARQRLKTLALFRSVRNRAAPKA